MTALRLIGYAITTIIVSVAVGAAAYFGMFAFYAVQAMAR